MYAIRSYYGFRTTTRNGACRCAATGGCSSFSSWRVPRRDFPGGRFLGKEKGTAGPFRITSYNVCYTKLLRELMDLLGPLPAAGADAVRTGVPASDHHDALPRGRDPPVLGYGLSSVV